MSIAHGDEDKETQNSIENRDDLWGGGDLMWWPVNVSTSFCSMVSWEI